MTIWAHNRTERNRSVGKQPNKHSEEELAPPRDWLDAFLLRRITADPSASKVKQSKIQVYEGPNNLDSCRHLISRIDAYLNSNAPEDQKLECLGHLLQLIQSAQEKESRRFISPESETIEGISRAVRKNFMDIAHHSTVHSGRTRLAFETSDNLERARTLVSRYRSLS
jgi:hypothetical protein